MNRPSSKDKRSSPCTQWSPDALPAEGRSEGERIAALSNVQDPVNLPAHSPELRSGNIGHLYGHSAPQVVNQHDSRHNFHAGGQTYLNALDKEHADPSTIDTVTRHQHLHSNLTTIHGRDIQALPPFDKFENESTFPYRRHSTYQPITKLSYEDAAINAPTNCHQRAQSSSGVYGYPETQFEARGRMNWALEQDAYHQLTGDERGDVNWTGVLLGAGAQFQDLPESVYEGTVCLDECEG